VQRNILSTGSRRKFKKKTQIAREFAGLPALASETDTLLMKPLDNPALNAECYIG
jgi:hypothetical protein